MLLRSDSDLSYPTSSLNYCSMSSHHVHIYHQINGHSSHGSSSDNRLYACTQRLFAAIQTSNPFSAAPPDQDSGPSTCRQCYSASCTLHLQPLSPPFKPAAVQKASKNKARFPKKPSKMREVASFYQVIISRCSELSKHKMC